jgi:hypothetical protein
MIGENIIECAIDFRHNTPQSNSLWDALETLNPSIKELDLALYRVIKKHGLSDSLFNHARNAESTTCYAIGIIAGLHLAGRVDLVPKFAQLYAQNTTDDEMWNYDDDGESIPHKSEVN